jgi:hypothetical protein
VRHREPNCRWTGFQGQKVWFNQKKPWFKQQKTWLKPMQNCGVTMCNSCKRYEYCNWGLLWIN